jgi:flagellar M-ring protein FliF
MLAQVRQQSLTAWGRLNPGQRIVILLLVVAALVLSGLFINWANTPSYAVAFSGLDETNAGQIVEKLDELGVPYQLRGSSTILVPSNQVYDVRLRMARESLPQGGSTGWELFSGSTLGMTEFTQQVNYRRALEGELERTIGSMEAISAVRVHIVTPEKTLLSDDQEPSTASITIQEKPGARLDAAQVRAITHLVASSVEGLKPESVVVVDVDGNLLASGTEGEDQSGAAVSDSHRAAELAYASDLQGKVQELLDSALGPNRSIVKAVVRMDWTQRETKQQAYDPDSTTIRSSQVLSETYQTASGGLSGIPGAASNLPPVATSTSSEGQGSAYQRTEQTTNYEVNQTEIHEVEAPGQVEQVSLSVLVDGVTEDSQLDTLRSTIAAAAGIDEARGDQLAVASLAFDRSYYESQASDFEATEQKDLYWKVGEIALAVIVFGALLWYIQRLLSNLRLASSEAWTPIMKTVSEVALPEPKPAAAQAAVHLQAAHMPAPTHHLPEPKFEFEIPALSKEDEQLQRMVAHLAEENPSSIAEIIQLWLNEDEK